MLRRAVLVALAVYCVLVVAVLLWPTPVDAPIAGPLDRLIVAAQRLGATWVTYGGIEFTANVAMFVPIGLLGGMLLPPRAFPVAVLVAAVGSAGFELAQHVLLENRTASLRDVVANTLGAAIGLAFAMLPALRPGTARPRS